MNSKLLAVGISHRTARVELREGSYLDESTSRSVLRALSHNPAVGESAVLSTCNRTELFAVGRDEERLEAALFRTLVAHSRVTADGLAHAMYVHAGQAAARHLFRVAASLDSMVLGESDIQGQVRAAGDLARREGALGPLLEQVFRHALQAGRRVRLRTRLGAGAVSVSSV